MTVKIGDMFTSKAQTLVNTVNCVGVMGKGIALEFKNRYPQMFQQYLDMCTAGLVKPGVPYYHSDLTGVSVLNFPTKDHWRSPSKLSYIVSGLKWFREHYQQYGINSIAFPPLGCGNGGLAWEIVGPLMFSMLSDLPIDIEIYAPYGTKSEQLTADYLKQHVIHSPKEILGAKTMPFNKNWLLLLHVTRELNKNQYALRVGRTIFQKICYALTREGVPTGFHFVRQSYGPYAEEVKPAITVLSNANLMNERCLGNMIETVVSPNYVFMPDDFAFEDLVAAEKTIDLFSRVKSTDQAEMISTVLFSYDTLKQNSRPTTEQAIFDYVLEWKPRWKNEKEQALIGAIKNLSSWGWMKPDPSEGMLVLDDDDIY